MIAYLLGLIANAEADIVNYRSEITTAKVELTKCEQLKPILTRIGENASNGYNQLQQAGNSLNRGMIIDNVGQGRNILDRSSVIKGLSSKSLAAANAVQNRINELNDNIDEYTFNINKLNASIGGWKSEIARLEAIARIEEEARRTAARIRNGGKK